MKTKRPLPFSMPTLLVFLIVGLVIGTFLAFVAFFLPGYQRTILQSAETSNGQAVEQVARTVSNYVADMDEIMDIACRNMEDPKADHQAFFEAFLKARTDIVAITTYDTQGTLLHCWTRNHIPKSFVTENLSFSLDTAGQGGISPPHVETLLENYYPWVVTMTARVGGESNQWIAIDLNFASISSYINGVGIGQHGYCYLMDEAGDLIYHPQQQLIYYGLKSEDTGPVVDLQDGSYAGEKTICSVQTITGSKWRVVGVSYVDELLKSDMDNMVRMLGGVVLVLLAVTLLCSILISGVLTTPLQTLGDAMKNFETDAGHYTYHAVSGTREVQNLSDSFGHMVQRIQKLMEQVRAEEVELRKTELKALQAQINPHFLYNTLDSIAWMCEQGRNHDAENMVNALATLFRISISKGRDLIPISREIEHAESYLQIQKFRYKNRFTYDFSVDASCKDYLCNKITLQPIIENAICHGLDMLEEGHIGVTVRPDGEDILFIIEDDGVGMPQQQADAMLNREAGDRTGIGIKNVNDRLRIYFGEKYGLKIQSEPDAGTRVTIRIPKVVEDRADEAK